MTRKKFPIVLDVEIKLYYTKAYKNVLKHRGNCPTWKAWCNGLPAKICLDCFGGGLNAFFDEVKPELFKRWQKENGN